MKLSDKIIKFRKSNGWSQEEFAEKLNVSRQTISRWENGTALPDAQNATKETNSFYSGNLLYSSSNMFGDWYGE